MRKAFVLILCGFFLFTSSSWHVFIFPRFFQFCPRSSLASRACELASFFFSLPLLQQQQRHQLLLLLTHPVPHSLTHSSLLILIYESFLSGAICRLSYFKETNANSCFQTHGRTTWLYTYTHTHAQHTSQSVI